MKDPQQNDLVIEIDEQIANLIEEINAGLAARPSIFPLALAPSSSMRSWGRLV